MIFQFILEQLPYVFLKHDFETMLTDTRMNIYQASEVDFLRVVVSFLIEVSIPK